MPASIRDPERSRLWNWARERRHNLFVERELLRWYFTGEGQITWPGMGKPFNDQHARTSAIELIIDEFQPDLFLETGTFFGHTTEMLSEYSKPVHTAELKRSFALISRRRLRRFPNTHVHRCPSLALIRRIPRAPGARLFAYLDAHWWSDDPPLASEVSALTGGWDELVVVIDDFKVPDDSGYIFDTWSDRDLDESFLSLPSSVRVAYPAVPSDNETGAAHGCGYVFQGDAALQALGRAVNEGMLRPSKAHSEAQTV